MASDAWNTFADPWKVVVTVAGSTWRATWLIWSIAAPSEAPGLSANEMLTAGSCP